MDSASKFEGLGDAYYAPAKKNSFVMWPFVLLEDLKRTEEMGLVTPMRSTAEHVEEIHRFYDRHPDVFRELMARPDMAALAFVPTVSSVPIEARRRGFDEFNSGASVTSAPARTSPVRQLNNQDFQDNDSVEIRSATRGVKSSGSVKVEGTISPLLTPRPLTNDDDRSSSDSSSINSRISSWSEIDQHMAPFRELLPIKSSFAPDPSLSTSDEPWAVAHAQISSAVVNLSDKVDALARLTTEAVEEDRLSGARSSKMIRKLKTAHLALTRDIMGTLNRAETIDDCGPLWEYVKEVAGWYSTLSASLEDCLVKTEEAATTAHAATSASQDVSEEMNLIASETAKGLVATSEEVAAYFDQVKERVDVLEGKVNRLAVPARSVQGAAHPSQAIHDYVTQLSARVHPPSAQSRSTVNVNSAPPADVNSPSAGSSDDLSSALAWCKALQDQLDKQQMLIADLQGSGAGANSGHGGDGVAVANFKFDGADEVQTLLADEGVNPARLAIFVDAVSLMAHSMDGYKTPTELAEQVKLMISCGIADGECHRTIFSFSAMYPSGLLTNDKTEVKEGETFPMLKSKGIWKGSMGYTGARAKFLEKIDVATQKAHTYISLHTKPGRLRELCLAMSRASQQFHHDLFTYLDNDFERLVQFGINEKDCLILVSDQIHIVFEQLFKKRMHLASFSQLNDLSEYAAQLAHISLKAHGIMDEFSRAGFEGHGMLGNAFVKFLARQCGTTSVAGLEKRLIKLEEEPKLREDAIHGVNSRIDECYTHMKNHYVKKQGGGGGGGRGGGAGGSTGAP